jgi:hypothetical protein
VLANLGPNLPDELVLAGLASWAAMLGAVRLEAFGHVDTVFAVPAVHFAAPTEIAGRQGVDLRPGPSAR